MIDEEISPIMTLNELHSLNLELSFEYFENETESEKEIQNRD